MFNKKKEEDKTEDKTFEIVWNQENRNGVTKEKEYTIWYTRKYITDALHRMSKEDVKKLRDLLNKTCFE